MLGYFKPFVISNSLAKKTAKCNALAVTGYWWSWGDLNPRPQALFGQIYMFSGLI